jgi:hypothetical protein
LVDVGTVDDASEVVVVVGRDVLGGEVAWPGVDPPANQTTRTTAASNRTSNTGRKRRRL